MDSVMIIHSSNINWGTGGVERYVRSQVSCYEEKGVPCFIVFPVRKSIGFVQLNYHGLMAGFDFKGVFRTEELIRFFNQIRQKNVMIRQVMIHHIMNVNLEAIRLIINSVEAEQVSFFIHDFYSACLQFNLMKNDTIYCGSAVLEKEKCAECAYYRKSLIHKKKVNAFFDLICCEKKQFVAPSFLVKQLWEEGFPQFKDDIEVIPHLKYKGEYNRKKEEITVNSDIKLRVAYVGHQMVSKGWDKWVEVSSHLLDENTDLELFYFGDKQDGRRGITNVNVSILKSGKDAMITALRENKIHIVVLFSCCPETYSYTYHETTAAGCYIVTNDESGNIAYMVRKNGNGIVLENTAESLYQFLVNEEKLKKEYQLYVNSNFKNPLDLEENIYLGKVDIGNIVENLNKDIITQMAHSGNRKDIIRDTMELLYRGKYRSYLSKRKI